MPGIVPEVRFSNSALVGTAATAKCRTVAPAKHVAPCTFSKGEEIEFDENGTRRERSVGSEGNAWNGRSDPRISATFITPGTRSGAEDRPTGRKSKTRSPRTIDDPVTKRFTEICHEKFFGNRISRSSHCLREKSQNCRPGRIERYFEDNRKLLLGSFVPLLFRIFVR